MKWPRKRFLLPVLICLLIVLAAADFHRFVRRVDALEPPALIEVDGVVALTGGSGKRIEAAIGLLEAGVGERLLVSGVHESVNTKDLIATAGGSDALYACCIDIGHEASSTEGNAIETANWARNRGYQRLIIVTSDYHTPRTRLWYRKMLPERDILFYPMQSKIQPGRWWHSWQSFRGLATEWAKYRVTAVLLAI